ncbi:MAG TPA: 1-(5-phosphoribosyl)-5-[(5-phosphoribosylamino)methylideneamino]imidazole-4-carboxamide isomerase [Vicinamibacteria bacterium]|nr:1-(5-phosphoribosyl)-5-[(5-phosphoribosylamino)methylideneamino]imidazole-4-carboxamide isomerase [Vicinamibacteria bacterium]
MIVVPAIDLRGGKVVRLKQGELQAEKVYGSDPVGCARFWEGEGAPRLHIVDLDAALGGRPQFDVVAAIIEQVSVPVEVGGGLRILENAMRYRDRGADRVIFGTAAVASPGVVQKAVQLWPAHVAVALDARNGRVALAGWTEVSDVAAVELAARVREWGVQRIQYTDVLRDGTLVGPNLAGIEQLARASGLRVTAAGGVATLDDVRRIAALEPHGLDELVVGKALYERRFSLAEAMEAAGP